MHSETALALTVLVLCYAAVSGLIRRWYLAPALIFVVVGIVLGPSCLGWIDVGSDTKGFTILSELALTVILFNQASTLNLRTAFRRGHLPLRLMAIGIPVSFALNTAIAVAVLPALPFWEAVCLAVIVAPTEVALLDALLEDRRVPERVRHALSIESGLYDGFALAALLAALALASEQTDHAAVRWAWFAFRTEFASLAIGVLIGAIGGLVISRSSTRGWMSGTWAQLAYPSARARLLWAWRAVARQRVSSPPSSVGWPTQLCCVATLPRLRRPRSPTLLAKFSSCWCSRFSARWQSCRPGATPIGELSFSQPSP